MQQIPKRPTLEKSNGAAAIFNPSMFHYQQALASMQLQQPAFIPTGSLFCMAPSGGIGLFKPPGPLAEGRWERRDWSSCRPPHSRYLSGPGQTDPAEVLTANPIDLHCIPVETNLCQVPKLLVAAPMSLNSVSLGRNLS